MFEHFHARGICSSAFKKVASLILLGVQESVQRKKIVEMSLCAHISTHFSSQKCLLPLYSDVSIDTTAVKVPIMCNESSSKYHMLFERRYVGSLRCSL